MKNKKVLKVFLVCMVVVSFLGMGSVVVGEEQNDDEIITKDEPCLIFNNTGGVKSYWMCLGFYDYWGSGNLSEGLYFGKGNVPGQNIYMAFRTNNTYIKSLVPTMFLMGSPGYEDWPSYSWDGDGHSGMYRPSDDNIGFSTGGTERVRFDNNGNVGIGTTTPSEKLDINGNLFMSGGDIKTDRWLEEDTNTFLGIGVVGAGNLAHATGNDGWYNTAIGYEALYSNTTGKQNTAIGYRTLYANTTGYWNVAVGNKPLDANTTGYGNIAIGADSLAKNTSGSFNIAIGQDVLNANLVGVSNVGVGIIALDYTTGSGNTALGDSASHRNSTGNFNVAVGISALYNQQTGDNNVAIGASAGQGSALHNKSGGVFIGYQAGQNEETSNKLYIENSNSATPLIYGDFDNDILAINGSLGIGTTSPQGKLDVNGSIYQRGSQLHADYVFNSDYNLESIEEHSEFMWKEKHLKAVPKAKKDENGQDIVEYGSHMRGMLEELEKAHVYIAKLNKMIKEQQKTISILSEKVEKLKKQVK